jgi:hypothetical protein
MASTAPAAAGPAVGTDEWKIATFTAAAPPEIAAGAAVMDWPDSATKEMKQLRAGTNGWTCMPSTPSGIGASKVEDTAPMCLDKQWIEWAGAWQAKTAPKVTSVGIGYMLHGDQGASNTDPYAMAPSADNDWVVVGPHIMVVVPDNKTLDGITTDHKLGGPFVMWKGTPYAHIMVPIGAHRM